MFIQVIEGKATDPEALHRQLEIWERDLMPGAIGYLGSSGGCTTTGDCILVARFESPEAARRNGERPEQTRWWQETERFFEGPVRFHDSVEVQVMAHGDLDTAHFVQVMEGHVADHDRAIQLEHDAEPILAELRPELLGSVTAYYGEDEFTELAFFTSEEAAREGERREMTPEAMDRFAEWQDLFKIDRYLDIRDPWLVKA